MRGGDGTRLVIVESPAKARTIAGYLGNGYVVESSVGHIRDMPDQAAEIPAKYRKEPWARLGVNVDDNFEALYVVPNDKRQQVSKLKDLLKDADELLLATDEDREGEAIAWHLLEELKPKVPYHRMVFHEITPEAIAQAVANPRELDQALVDAYQARRVLDRLYGYEVSPVLWKKVMPRLSAGRVQSVATRLVVDRERERIAFRAAQYWDLEAEFATLTRGDADGLPRRGTARGHVRSARRWSPWTGGALPRAATSTQSANCAAATFCTLTGPPRRHWPAGCRTPHFRSVRSSESPTSGPRTRRSARPPSSRRRRGSSASPPSRTMSVAQRLYENGYITYMRTDSTTLSQTAIDAARRQARDLYGESYVPDAPRVYASKVKNAQEAHEAISPSGDHFRTPEQVARDGLSRDEQRLYDLVWKRTVASQMKDATGESVSVRVAGTSSAGENAEFGASGNVIKFYGFLKAYVEGADDPNADRDDRERRLPPLATTTRWWCCAWRPPSTRPVRPRGTPRPRWSRSLRTGRSAAHRRTRRSSARSWTVATCSRRAPRSSRRTWPSPWSRCWSGTSASSWTTSSPRGWKACSTRSRTARRRVCRGCAGSTSAATSPGRPGSRTATRPTEPEPSTKRA